MRLCGIVYGAIEDAQGRGDGAYDLLDIVGTPKQIGDAIASSLEQSSLMTGCRDIIEEGGDVYLVVKVKFCDPDKCGPRTDAQMIGAEEVVVDAACDNSQAWHDCGEGPWECVVSAAEFAHAECPEPFRLQQEADGKWHVFLPKYV